MILNGHYSAHFQVLTVFVFSVSTVTCLHALKSSLFFSYCLCCSTSVHPLSETRAQSALIG